jgi:hypothetical protein
VTPHGSGPPRCRAANVRCTWLINTGHIEEVCLGSARPAWRTPERPKRTSDSSTAVAAFSSYRPYTSPRVWLRDLKGRAMIDLLPAREPGAPAAWSGSANWRRVHQSRSGGRRRRLSGALSPALQTPRPDPADAVTVGACEKKSNSRRRTSKSCQRRSKSCQRRWSRPQKRSKSPRKPVGVGRKMSESWRWMAQSSKKKIGMLPISIRMTRIEVGIIPRNSRRGARRDRDGSKEHRGGPDRRRRDLRQPGIITKKIGIPSIQVGPHQRTC